MNLRLKTEEIMPDSNDEKKKYIFARGLYEKSDDGG